MVEVDDASGNIVRLPRAKGTKRESDKKWGSRVMALGFCIVPSLLLRAQQRLGLNPTQLAVLMQLCDFWWDGDRKPFPSKAILAERLGLSPRQVQRHVAELEAAGLLKRIERRAGHGGKQSNIYDLGGLVARLKALEPQFSEVQRQTAEARKALSRRGYRPKQAQDCGGPTA